MRSAWVLLAAVSAALPLGASSATGADRATAGADGADAAVWQQLFPATTPPGRFDAQMSYDAGRDEVVMFGGLLANGRTLVDETWAWDGSTWTELHPPSAPRARSLHAMAYDAARDELVLFGGGITRRSGDYEYLADTWTFADGEWTRHHPPTSPSPRVAGTMVFDPHLQQVILFGGYTDDFTAELWTWDGTTWSLLDADGPSARTGSRAAYHPGLDAVVLFGGRDRDRQLRDTWKWDGSAWKKMSLDKSPPRRTRHSMSTLGDRAAVFGGLHGNDWENDTWVLRRHRWVEAHNFHSPDDTYGAGLEWDPVRGVAVLFGSPYGDDVATWALTP